MPNSRSLGISSETGTLLPQESIVKAATHFHNMMQIKMYAVLLKHEAWNQSNAWAVKLLSNTGFLQCCWYSVANPFSHCVATIG